MREKPSGRVLVVDDDREILTPLCDILSETGYQAECFQSCAKALETFRAKEFDLLLVDLKMPEMDGIEFLKAAQKADPLVVCIIITGHSTVQTAVEAMKMGAFDYLTKPLNWKTLQPVLTRAMEVRRIRKSEEQYRAVVEQQIDLICRCRADGTLLFVNEAYCRYFGKTKEELIGLNYLSWVPAEDHEALRQHLSDFTREKPVALIETRVIAPGGEIRWQQWTNRAFFSDDGCVIELQTIGRDITERRRMEKDLQQSEERYRQLVETMNEGMGVMDERAGITFVNESFCKMLDYAKEDMIGRSVFDFVDSADLPLLEDQIRQRKKGESGEYEMQWVRRNGQKIYTIVSPQPVFNERGQFKGSFAVLTNITERKKTEEALKKSHEQLRSFAKRLSEAEEIERQRIARELHDRVGQNVTALGLNLSIVRNQLPDTLAGQLDSRLNDSMSILDEIAKRIRDVMSDLRPSVLDDYGLAAAITWLADQVAKRTGLTIKVESHDRGTSLPPEMEITFFRIAQELLTNITKHAKATEVSIRLDESDGAVLFVVADNGIGFDPAALTATEEPRWGLLNVEERAQAVGGTMTIQSTIGQGTRVAIEVKK